MSIIEAMVGFRLLLQMLKPIKTNAAFSCFCPFPSCRIQDRLLTWILQQLAPTQTLLPNDPNLVDRVTSAVVDAVLKIDEQEQTIRALRIDLRNLRLQSAPSSASLLPLPSALGGELGWRV